MAKNPKLGQAVVYRAHAEHKTETVKKDANGKEITLQGSLHHPEMEEFAGLVGRVHADGSADLIIFPPNRPAVWVDAVKQGEGDHEFSAA